jgi:4-carboxymuconolactone decarboxylase
MTYAAALIREGVLMTEGPPQPRILPMTDDRDPPSLNIFRTVKRNRGLYKGFLGLGFYLLDGGGLPAREREIVILRVGWRAASEYEFAQHSALGTRAGLSQREIGWLADVGPSAWAPDDLALVHLADELCDNDLVSDATWNALADRWSQAEILEFLVLAGFYRMVSGVLNSAGVPLERGAAGWPSAATAKRHAPRET